MTRLPIDGVLDRATDDDLARPIPAALRRARDDVRAAAQAFATLTDADMTTPWAWTGESDEEVRYAAYRIAESFEAAAIDAADALRGAAASRGRAADLIAPATAATWDLTGLLLPLDAPTWDADPGGGEWTIRQTLGHVVSGQRAYGIGTGWWLEQAYPATDLTRPPGIPDELWTDLPSEEAEAEGTPTEVVDRLAEVVDWTTERLAGLPADRLALGARWGGYPIDIAFRLNRWASHIREHTIQVEKTLDLLGHRPTEVDRLVRHVLAAWGRAESVVYGAVDADRAIEPLARAATQARATAAEVASVSSPPS